MSRPSAVTDTVRGDAPSVPSTAPVTGLVYLGLPQPLVDQRTADAIAPDTARLSNLLRVPGKPMRLVGTQVEVTNAGVLVERDPVTGTLRGVPMGNATAPPSEGDAGCHFCYQPRNGGPRPRDNERLAGAGNEQALEAARFGEVNAYYHADRTLTYINGLLAELGEHPLPALRLVVECHPYSRLPGYGHGDGDRRGRKAVTFSGGHYRRPDKHDRDSYFAHRPREMNPNGEVHLGPGNGPIRDAAGNILLVHGEPYNRKPSHNAGIIIHEVGHHIVSHTADFRCNRDRQPDACSHRKIHMDEGFSDYWAAVLLGTPTIYAWHRAGEPLDAQSNRDLRGPRTTADFVQGGDPHENGNIWSSALWDLRTALGDDRQADLLALQMLALCGQVGPANPGRDRAIRARKMARKEGFRDGLAFLLQADARLSGGVRHALIQEIFAARGVDLETPDRDYGRRQA